MSNQTESTPPIKADHPIQYPDEDTLERNGPAISFANHVLSLDASKGVAVGLFGPWGSGKTSFLNLARIEFKAKKAVVLDFNPWLFSGTEQLVHQFFHDLATKLRKRNLKPIGKALREYGDAIGGKFGAFLNVWNIWRLRRQGGPEGLRKKVEKELKKTGKKEGRKSIVVVLDDVDRLTKTEIRNVLKLVRLTASFPNVIYIVVCDRHKIEKALEDEGYSGRDYLDKIIQWPYNLPTIPPKKLQEQIDAEIRKVVGSIESEGVLNQEIWHFIRNGIVCPLIETMRDVRRYANAVWQTAVDLEGQVELADVLGLEAVRLFLPDTFSRLPNAIDVLTYGSPSEMEERRRNQLEKSAASGSSGDISLSNQERKGRERIDELIRAEGKQKEDVMIALIRILFPKGAAAVFGDGTKKTGAPYAIPSGPNQECRVLNQSIFRLYLERVGNEGTSALSRAREAFKFMSNQRNFGRYMRNIDQMRLLDAIDRLGNLEEEYQPEHARPGIVVLLNLLSNLPRRVEGRGSHGYDQSIKRVVAGLLETQTTADAVDKLVKDILPKVTSLSSKWMLFDQIKSKSANSEVFLDAIVQECRSHLLDAILSASIDHLAGERSIRNILSFKDEEFRKKMIDRIRNKKSSKMTFAILYISYNEVPGNAWPYLKDIYGEENLIRAKIDHLQSEFGKLKPWIKNLPMDFGQAERLLEKAVLELNNGTALEQLAAES